MKKPCKYPCPSCPFTNKADKGYFGGNNPEEYAQSIHQDTVVACHTRTKHNEATGLPNSDNDIVICTGHIVSQIKACKNTIHPEGKKAKEQIMAQDNFENLKEKALAFDFKQYHGI